MESRTSDAKQSLDETNESPTHGKHETASEMREDNIVSASLSRLL
jgi:hypothetical protein